MGGDDETGREREIDCDAAEICLPGNFGGQFECMAFFVLWRKVYRTRVYLYYVLSILNIYVV